MLSQIKGLMAGDQRVIDVFQTAQKFWEDFFQTADTSTVKALASALSRGQSTLEAKLDMNRGTAKEIMPYTCLGYLYDERDGFKDRALAKRVVEAFAESNVSLEVKYMAARAEVLFNLNDG